jgi:hypothetical protein
MIKFQPPYPCNHVPCHPPHCHPLLHNVPVQSPIVLNSFPMLLLLCARCLRRRYVFEERIWFASKCRTKQTLGCTLGLVIELKTRGVGTHRAKSEPIAKGEEVDCRHGCG